MPPSTNTPTPAAAPTVTPGLNYGTQNTDPTSVAINGGNASALQKARASYMNPTQYAGIYGAPPSTAVTTPSITPTTQGNTSPTIDASTITGTTKYKLPSAAPSSGDAPAVAAIGKAAGINEGLTASQNALLDTTTAGANAAQDTYNADKNSVTGIISKYMNKGADQIAQENAAGIPGMRQMAAELTTQYRTQQLAYNAQYNSILNDPSGTMEQKAQAISALQQQHGFELTDTSIRQALAQTNYTAAQEVINHQIDIKYAPMKDAIDFGMQFMAQNKDILTSKQAQSFSANLAVQSQMYNQGIYYDHMLSDAKVAMVKDAVANGAPSAVIDGIWTAPSVGAAGKAAASFLNGEDPNSYAPVQTGFDSTTGLPIYSKVDPTTGQLTPYNPRNILGTTGSADTTVNGYQFGATTTLGAYASNTETQVNNIKTTVGKISAAVGTVSDTAGADAALKVATGGKKSPVTGAMVMAAAQQYGVDPATIIGVMQAETQCGTDGSKGARECNYGNVGNTDALMASGKSVKMNPQQGVDAIAKNLAIRKVQPGQTDPSQPSPDGTLTPQQKAQNIIKSAPVLIRNAMQHPTSGGDVYIDASQVPQNMTTVAQSWAVRNGVPYLTGEQAAIVKQTDEAIRNITDVTAPAWNKIAPQTVFGQADNFLGHYRESYNGDGLQPSDQYTNNKAYKDNKESLAQQIRALAQAAPKAGLLTTAENSIPTNEGYFNPGGQYDTVKSGNKKMDKTLQLLTQTLRTYIPNAQPVTVEDALKQAKQADTIIMTSPEGKQFNVPIDQKTTFVANGYH